MQNRKSIISTIIVGCFVALAVCILLVLNLMKAGDEKNNPTETTESVISTTQEETAAQVVTFSENTETVESQPFDIENSPFSIYPTNPDSVINCGVKKLVIPHGDETLIFSVGIENDFDRAIILNPMCEQATEKRVIGYYMTCPYGGALLYEQTGPYLLPEMREKGKKNALIQRTYDKLYNVEFEDLNHFGVSWAPDFQTGEDQFIDVRAIDLDNHELLALFRIVLTVENGKYKISALHSLQVEGDIADTLSHMAREAMKNGVIGSLKEGSYENTPVLIERRDYRTYFTSFVSASRNAMLYAGNVQYPVYAVSVNTEVETLSFVTFYYTYTADPITGATQYTLLGYDALFPFTEDTIITYD